MAQLYRHYDAAGNLLYVGISLIALRRLAAHEVHAGWWGDVRMITIEPFPNTVEAHRAEVEAIRNERPRWNLQHADPSTKQRPPVAQADLGKDLLRRLRAANRAAESAGTAGAVDYTSFEERAAQTLAGLAGLKTQ